MAHSYFSPRPGARRHSFSDRPSADEELAGDLEQSIFIFPSPRTASDPPSPLSIPTDVSFPSTMTTEGRGRRISNASGVSEWATLSGRSMSVDTALRSPLVEVWEMSDEADGEGSVGDETPSPVVPLNVNMFTLNRQQQRYPLGRQPFPSVFTFSDGRFQLRTRKESLISAIDGQDYDKISAYSASSFSTPDTPSFVHASNGPTSRLPLLAFFSSLLSIEDPTLHLLTSPSHPHASPLFPGSHLEPPSSSNADLTLVEKRPLFTPSNTLKAGIEVATDPSISVDSIFAIPLPPLPFAYIWKFVTGVCSASAPRRVRVWARAPA